MMARSRRPGSEGGFTIVELLVAVSLGVLLVSVVTMAFQVTAGTIKTVQRKLDIYEAARGVLQEMAMAMKPAGLTLRGEHFIIKSVAWQDEPGVDPSDQVTPEDTDKAGAQMLAKMTSPVGDAMDATRYQFSRRECDCFVYAQSSMTGTGCGTDPSFGYAAYNQGGLLSECWRHSLLNESSWGFNHYDIFRVLEMEIEPQGKNFTMPSNDQRDDPDGDGTESWFRSSSQLEEYEFRPGREYSGTSEVFGASRSRANIKAMDFNVSFWHDQLQRYVDPPDYTMIALAPLPRSIKVTVSIWDFDGKGYETFSRIIWLPAGIGGVQTVGGAAVATYGPGLHNWVSNIDPATLGYGDADSDWATPTVNVAGRTDNPGTGRSAYFNRFKQVVGSVTWDYATNWNLINYGSDEPSEGGW